MWPSAKIKTQAMKINRSKGSLQSELAKMLEAGKENVEGNDALRANTQGSSAGQGQGTTAAVYGSAQNQPHPAESQAVTANDGSAAGNDGSAAGNGGSTTANAQRGNGGTIARNGANGNDAYGSTVARNGARQDDGFGTVARNGARQGDGFGAVARNGANGQDDGNGHRPNAAQRREVPDRNAKYAGEPIKSVGCRMPQSLYARMLQYKALNDTQLNRITLNDIIIEAVDNFLETRL